MPQAAVLTPGDVQEFANSVLGRDLTHAHTFVERGREPGLSLEAAIMDFLGPTVCYLGELWQSDQCRFAEVAIRLSRLRLMVRAFYSEFGRHSYPLGEANKALLLVTPGNQHTFGLFVFEAFFRREGWEVTREQIDAGNGIANLVGKQRFAIMGFSPSCERFSVRLASLIRIVRRYSYNRNIGTLVGGSLFALKSDRAERVGADCCAIDACAAVMNNRFMLNRKSAPS